MTFTLNYAAFFYQSSRLSACGAEPSGGLNAGPFSRSLHYRMRPRAWLTGYGRKASLAAVSDPHGHILSKT